MKKIVSVLVVLGIVFMMSSCDFLNKEEDKDNRIIFEDGVLLEENLSALSIVKDVKVDTKGMTNVNASEGDIFQTVLKCYSDNGVAKTVVVDGYSPVSIYTENNFSVLQYYNNNSNEFKEFINNGEIIIDNTFDFKWDSGVDKKYKTFLIDNKNGLMYSLESFYQSKDFDAVLQLQNSNERMKNFHMKNDALYFMDDESIVKIDFKDNQLRIYEHYNLADKFNNVNKFEDLSVDNDGRLLLSYSYTLSGEETYGLMFSDPINLIEKEIKVDDGNVLPKTILSNDEFFFLTENSNKVTLNKLIKSNSTRIVESVWESEVVDFALDDLHKYSVTKIGDDKVLLLDKDNDEFNYIKINLKSSGGISNKIIKVDEPIDNFILGLNENLYVITEKTDTAIKLSNLIKYDLSNSIITKELLNNENLFYSLNINDHTEELYAIGAFSNSEMIIKVYDQYDRVVDSDTLDLADKSAIYVSAVN